jgi:cobalt-zinc-cadmium efflux system membrane fusion protein
MRTGISVYCLLVCLFAASGCSGPTSDAPAMALAEQRSAPPPEDGVIRIAEGSRPFIDVQTVEEAGDGGELTVPAKVEFRDGALAQISAPFAGRVVRVHVRTGDAVKIGDPLVTIDCPDAASGRAAVQTARAGLREAQVALEREQRMLAEGVGTEREKLEAETKVAELRAELARAEAAAAFVGEGAGTEVVLRAPISGTVVSRKASEGMAVQEGGEPLVEVGNPSDLWIVGDVFERDLPLVREGANATVVFPSMHDELSGRVASIGAVVSSGLRTAPVRVAVDSNGMTLRPGMYGRLRVKGSGVEGPTLPAEAVLIKGKDSIVYVETDPLTFTRRNVTVGRSIGGRVHVLSGLSPQDKVVVRGAVFLDGAADQLI